MEAAAASTEIAVLGWSVVLLLLQVDRPGLRRRGPRRGNIFSARVTKRACRAICAAGRLLRALRNLLETYPAFVALALALVVTGRTGGIGAAGAWLWLAARVVYVGFYAAGVPVLRTLAWFVSIVGLVMMLIRLMA